MAFHRSGDLWGLRPHDLRGNRGTGRRRAGELGVHGIRLSISLRALARSLRSSVLMGEPTSVRAQTQAIKPHARRTVPRSGSPAAGPQPEIGSRRMMIMKYNAHIGKVQSE